MNKKVVFLFLCICILIPAVFFGTKKLSVEKPIKRKHKIDLEAVRKDPQMAGVSELMALPYLQGYFKAPEKTNVVRYNRSLAHKGYNLYTSGHKGAAYLIDMTGNVLHEWSYDLKDIWPELIEEGIAPFWENVHLLANGDLLAIYHDGGVIKIDKDSNLIWSYKTTSHHALSVDDNGNIYTLTEDRLKLKEDVYLLDNSILVLSSEGKLLGKVSLLNAMRTSKNPIIDQFFKNVLGIAFKGGEDVFHTNTIQILDGSSADKSPILFKKGNLMLCMLTIGSIAIYDLQLNDFVWILGPQLWTHGQHDPRLLANGNVLIFDNHYKGTKKYSRILEFEPLTREIAWEYTAEDFYSDTHGANERLANGNTLIIETNKGRVFEVTPQKEIVWEFLNPHTTGDNNDLIAAVFMLYRIDPSAVSGWLK